MTGSPNVCAKLELVAPALATSSSVHSLRPLARRDEGMRQNPCSRNCCAICMTPSGVMKKPASEIREWLPASDVTFPIMWIVPGSMNTSRLGFGMTKRPIPRRRSSSFSV